MPDHPVPSTQEMKQATKQIREACLRAPKKHQEILSELARRLHPIPVLAALGGAEYARVVKYQYLDAIAVLLSLAVRPDRDTLSRTMERLFKVTGTEVRDVRVITVDGPEAGATTLLSESLPAAKKRSAKELALLAEFRGQLQHLPDWPQAGPDESNERGDH